ncbi:MAG: hypothetical protein NWE89_02595 [Candidatus Bathyarchaeota archaeon]|nr:hypothetical protein [Candidatus Bathyarchaeota archaeon]
MEKSNTKWIIATAAVTLASFLIGYYAFGGGRTGVMLAAPLGLIVGILVPFFKKMNDTRQARKQGISVEDELSHLLNGKAAWVAFQVGNYFVLALMWYSFVSTSLMDRSPMEVPSVLILALLVRIAIYGAARLYYGKNPVR